MIMDLATPARAPADEADHARDTSLAYTDQTCAEKVGLTCENSPRSRVIELFSGDVFPAGCKRLTCQACLPRRARRRTLAITAVQPYRMIRLSLVADSEDEEPWTTARKRINRTRSVLRRNGQDPGEWTFTIERNPKSTGFHAHCLQSGLYIAQSTLQSASKSAGAGIPYINAIKRPGMWSSQYGLKGFGADGYGLKTYRSIGSQHEALRINGGRLEHHSKGFFTIAGRRYGVRQAERVALVVRNEGKPVLFWPTMDDEAGRLAADPEARRRIIASVNGPTPGARVG
jgi:hypothetical protein